MKVIKIAIILVFILSVAALTVFRSERTAAQSGGSIETPTGVSASNGSYTTKIGINWDPMRGATVYRIFRSAADNQFAATEIGTTAAPYFFDRTAAQNTNFFYWVRAESPTAISQLSNSVQGLRANGTPNGPIAPLEPPNAPTGNPVTAAKTALGKVLFWEEQLSSTKTVACVTCHINGASGSDPRSVVGDVSSTHPGADGIFGTGDDVIGSPGVPVSNSVGAYQWSTASGVRPQVTSRRSMPATNAGYAPLLFWDGRASQTFRDPITNLILLNGNAALESQAVGPPLSSVEMAHTGRDWNSTASELAAVKPLALATNIPPALTTWMGGRTYPEMFAEAFGTSEVSSARIAMAIATYERVLFSDRTPFDLFVGGANTLTAAEQRGRNIYNTTNCNLCHGGSLL
ncbi:MAG: cytochrome-c peroxidase, partial [Pyrinomonadaceae bacterium]